MFQRLSALKSASPSGVGERISTSVDASAISVETLNGEVILSGFAKTSAEKTRAQELAHQVKGVRAVKNSLEVRG